MLLNFDSTFSYEVHVLSNAYPNPFNPTVSIPFALPYESNVVISVYNIMGQIVKTLTKAQLSIGFHTVRWHGINAYGEPVPSGMYFVQMNAQSVDGNKTFQQSQKIVLLK